MRKNCKEIIKELRNAYSGDYYVSSYEDEPIDLRSALGAGEVELATQKDKERFFNRFLSVTEFRAYYNGDYATLLEISEQSEVLLYIAERLYAKGINCFAWLVDQLQRYPWYNRDIYYGYEDSLRVGPMGWTYFVIHEDEEGHLVMDEQNYLSQEFIDTHSWEDCERYKTNSEVEEIEETSELSSNTLQLLEECR